MKITVHLFLIMLLAGCQSANQDNYDEICREGGLFRGFELKDGLAQILANEDNEFLVVNEKVYLRYEYPLVQDHPEEGNYKVEYYFDGEDQLHEVIFEIYLKNKEQSLRLFNRLQERFTLLLGEGKKNADGYTIWRGKTKNTPLLEIALLDDSQYLEEKGYITLQLNDFDY